MSLYYRPGSGSSMLVIASVSVDWYNWFSHILQLRSKGTAIMENMDKTLQWRHNERDGVSNRQSHDCFLNRLFKAQIKENIKAPRHKPLWGEFTGDRWIPRTKVQQRGKCFDFYDVIMHCFILGRYSTMKTAGPVRRNMFPFDDVIMLSTHSYCKQQHNANKECACNFGIQTIHINSQKRRCEKHVRLNLLQETNNFSMIITKYIT